MAAERHVKNARHIEIGLQKIDGQDRSCEILYT